MIAALSETTSTPFLPALRDEMFSTAEGRAILRDRPRIHSETIDLDHLRSLPDGTLGRSYCDWLEKCNTSPDTRAPVHHVDDPELAYVLQRYRSVLLITARRRRLKCRSSTSASFRADPLSFCHYLGLQGDT